jgi:hypothetical protein
MRHLIITVLLAAGCDAGKPSNTLLCDFCDNDNQCAGAPCFTDKSGGHYCGQTCTPGGTDCPMGFSCTGITGTAGTVLASCFPNNLSCMNTMVPGQADLSMTTNPGQDGGSPRIDAGPAACAMPAGGSVSLSGGTVDRIFFGYTGDTRDSSSTTHYSSQLQGVINSIYTQMATRGVEFALDGGDHMEASNFTEAQGNMADYLTASSKLGKPVFMTLGNHECSLSFNQDCGGGEIHSDSKGQAFLSALQSTVGATEPYYRFDVMTATGKATFLVVADDAWDSTQQSWLTQQLTDADANSKYTFVSKHHPDGNTDQPSFQQIYNLVKAHKYTLFMTGHSHEYKRQYNDHRAIVMGLGGAPFDNPNQQWWGYFTAMQCEDDHIYVNVYDVTTGNVQDHFDVPPQ